MGRATQKGIWEAGSALQPEGVDISTAVNNAYDFNMRRSNLVEDGPGPYEDPPCSRVSGDHGTGTRELREAECALQEEPDQGCGRFWALKGDKWPKCPRCPGAQPPR